MILLILEYLLVFFGIPFLFFKGLISFWVLPVLWLAMIPYGIFLYKDPDFKKEQLWNFDSARGNFKTMGILILISTLGLIGILWFKEPQLLFLVIKKKPLFWVIGVLGYPLLSVYPQEVIFRAYFFQRFGKFIRNDMILILLSAIAFSYMHIVFKNWYAVLFTFPGGILFARSWVKTRSLALPSIEHSLYGQILLTVGYGTYFLKDYKHILEN
ncbi:MAG: CPBP family intramembrane metalloprotease [Halobacteriovoraceae bacterium]|nr:CPBP family intramembrane metalloprotease [Halobacteriovoraceae bacterium]